MTDYLAQQVDIRDPHTVMARDELSLWSARFGMLLLDHLKLEPLTAILDAGCGAGFPLFELAQMFGDACQVTGVDVWEEALDRARMKQQVYQVRNVRLLHADAAALPLPDATFDLITSNLGLNNFDQPELVLAECARVARPHARLMLTTNPMGTMREFYDSYRDVLTEHGNTHAVEALARQEAHRGTKESVCDLVRGAGFTIARVTEDQFQLRYLDGSAFLRHFFIRLGFLSDWRGVIDAHDEAEIFGQVEDRLNQKARQDGELRMTIPMLLVEAERNAAA